MNALPPRLSVGGGGGAERRQDRVEIRAGGPRVRAGTPGGAQRRGSHRPAWAEAVGVGFVERIFPRGQQRVGRDGSDAPAANFRGF